MWPNCVIELLPNETQSIVVGDAFVWEYLINSDHNFFNPVENKAWFEAWIYFSLNFLFGINFYKYSTQSEIVQLKYRNRDVC